MKTMQNHLKVQLSDAQEDEVWFSRLANCTTFNGASLRAAQDGDPNVSH